MAHHITRRHFATVAVGSAAACALTGAAAAFAAPSASRDASGSTAADAGASAAADVASAAPSFTPGAPTQGIARVCISVNDLDASALFFTNFLEFTQVACGMLGAEEVGALYGLEGGARYVMLANAWQTTLVELVEFDARTGACIRTGRDSWDPGFFDMAMRCDDNKAVRDHLVKLGYSYYCEPHEYTTEWSGSTVSEAVACGVDDMPLTLIETVSEPRPVFDGLFKNVTDVAQCVSSVDAADAFYGDVLGLAKVYDEEVVGLVDAILNLPKDTPTRIAMYSVDGTPVVELLQISLEGKPMSDVARPENAGLFATAFEVDDISATLSACAEQGFSAHGEPAECFVAPYGNVRSVLVDGPDGMLVELFERLG